MRTVNIREARRKLSELVDAAEQGQSIVITRRGKEVARIEPAHHADGGSLPDLSEFRKSIAATLRDKAQPLSQAVTEQRERDRY